MSAVVTRKGKVLQDPPFVQKLLNDSRFAWIWLVLRVWVGYQWISASLHKWSSPAWVQTGDALKGFWTSAVAIPESGSPAIHSEALSPSPFFIGIFTSYFSTIARAVHLL